MAAVQPGDVASTKEQQKFLQFLRYHKEKNTGKAADCQELGSLYKSCTGADERRAFIQRWLHAGGSKGDVKALIEQEVILRNESKKDLTTGFQTPGNIAKLLNLNHNWYPTVDLFQQALQREIAANQAAHPPPGDVSTSRRGLLVFQVLVSLPGC